MFCVPAFVPPAMNNSSLYSWQLENSTSVEILWIERHVTIYQKNMFYCELQLNELLWQFLESIKFASNIIYIRRPTIWYVEPQPGGLWALLLCNTAVSTWLGNSSNRWTRSKVWSDEGLRGLNLLYLDESLEVTTCTPRRFSSSSVNPSSFNSFTQSSQESAQGSWRL